MKFRVHYSHRGRDHVATVEAETKGAATTAFRYHHPNCVPRRIELVASTSPARPRVVAVKAPEPVVRVRVAEQVQALREKLGLRADRHSSRVLTDNGRWFARGKEARLHGEGRDLVDGRMTPNHRAAFQAGWDEQERFMQPPTPAQAEKAAEIAARLREWASRSLS